jgi:hypothetical protein
VKTQKENMIVTRCVCMCELKTIHGFEDQMCVALSLDGVPFTFLDIFFFLLSVFMAHKVSMTT